MSATLQTRLAAVRARIVEAARRAGRDLEAVTLIGVTKQVPAEVVREAVALGLGDLGENRVQEAAAKRAALSPQPRRWHLIGHLQRNKAADAVVGFDVIHSVDSLALLDALERAAEKAGRTPAILLQVNVSGEASKSGCRPDEAPRLGQAAAERPHLRLSGLMTIPPWAADPEAARPHFRQLAALREALQQARKLPAGALKLSMGMSGDFEVAIEEGADYVRIGTAIFGDRTGKGTA